MTSGESVGRRVLALAVGTMVVAAWASAPVATAGEWPVYGRDLANSRSAGTDGPSREDAAKLAPAWKFSDPDGDFTGTPVVAGGLVVAGSFAGHVHALDAKTGKEVWSADAGGPVNGSAAIDLDAPDGGAVYVPVAIVGAPRLVALSLRDGSPRWSAVLTEQDGASCYGSPTFWDGTVYMGTSGPNGDDSTARGSVVALDAKTGALRWRTFTVPPDHDGGPVWSTPAIDTATGRLYVGTGNAYHGEAADTTDAILSLDTRTGAILGHYAAVADDSFAPDNPAGPDADFGASPNLFDGPDGRRLVGEGAKTGTYYALDRLAMTPAWQTLAGPGSAAGGIIGSTAYDGARIYGNDALNGEVWSLGRDGKKLWSSSDSGPADFGPVAVGNGVLYTTDPQGNLNARDVNTGAVLKRAALGATTWGGISVSGGGVFVAMGMGPLFDPAPQKTQPGAIIAFGDPARLGAPDAARPPAAAPPAPPASAPAPPTQPPGGKGRRARIRLSVTPHRVRAGHRVRFRFRTRVNGRPVGNVLIYFANRRAHSDARGRATITVRLRPGRYSARGVDLKGRDLLQGRTRVPVRVTRRRAAPRP
ncbi:MAG TPA: PQQ-binding-like beta-propeller repeat protein [Solirubrobacteraceae bacterium]|jgi:polyvinyl alcohol dehydrogenase (cytochrome)